jgi:hypothetical protein
MCSGRLLLGPSTIAAVRPGSASRFTSRGQCEAGSRTRLARPLSEKTDRESHGQAGCSSTGNG